MKGRSYYRDINLYFAYYFIFCILYYKQLFSSGPDFFNEIICEKTTNTNFNLTEFGKKNYYIEKKGNGYAIGTVQKGELWVTEAI